MGTIQPSRFLSHTGKILPGVRRVFTIPQPVAGAGFSFTVPAGVQWWVTAANFVLTTDAVVANRQVEATTTVDGFLIATVTSAIAQPASRIDPYGLQSSNGYTALTNAAIVGVMALPAGYLPSGAVVAVSAAAIDVADQFSACNVWIEEVYVTDPQLSEIARTRAELDREIAMYEFQQAEQTSQG